MVLDLLKSSYLTTYMQVTFQEDRPNTY